LIHHQSRQQLLYLQVWYRVLHHLHRLLMLLLKKLIDYLDFLHLMDLVQVLPHKVLHFHHYQL
jgi:hypothetical protein